MAAQQNLRHWPATVLWRAGVLRVFQQACRMRLLLRRASRQHARQQPCHRIHDDQRGQLAARQHEISQRKLIATEMRAHTLVYALVMSANQRDAWLARQLTRNALSEHAPLR